jgi:hypothetical protein
MALVSLALAACNDEIAGESASDSASGGQAIPISCEDGQVTPPIDNLRPAQLLRVGEPGWRVEPLVATDGGILACITHYEPGHPGQLQRWAPGSPVPEVLAELPHSRRIIAAAPGPDAIYLLSLATDIQTADTVKSAVLVVRDGATQVLLERDDLRKYPPLLYSGAAAYAQLESGEMLKIPGDGSPAAVFSPPCERAAIDDDTLYLLRIIPPEDSGADAPFFRIDRQDLATGVVEPHSQPLCIHDAEPADDVSTMLLHGGVPWVNTRATIATLDGQGARVNHVLLPDTRLRGLRSDDALYFFSGMYDDPEAVFYRLPTDGGPFEVIARLPKPDQAQVNGWTVAPDGHYIAINQPLHNEVWRIAR